MNSSIDSNKFTIKKMVWQDRIRSRTYMDGRTEEYHDGTQGTLGQYLAIVTQDKNGKFIGTLYCNDYTYDDITCDTLEECKAKIEQLAIDEIQYFLDNHVE